MSDQKHVLYCDDDDQLRAGFEIAAKNAGHTFMTFPGGTACWEHIAGCAMLGKRIDLIMSDDDMQDVCDINGIELLRLVRSNPLTASIPFVLVCENDNWSSKLNATALCAFHEDKIGTTFPKLLTKHLPLSEACERQ